MAQDIYSVAGSYIWTVPNGVSIVAFDIIGAGGGGAGSSPTQGGGGGGGGGYVIGQITGLQAGSGISFNVGLGGSGGAHGVNGGVGGASFIPLYNIVGSGGRSGSIVSSTNGGAGGSGINPFLGSISVGASGSNGVSNGGNGGIANYFASVAGAGGILNVSQNGGSGLIGGGGGGASTSGAGGTGRGGTGGDGYVIFTYSLPTTPLSGNFTLFIGQICGQSIYPSGDAGVSPSGLITNSIGTSGNLYSYISDDPNSSLTDTTFVRVSGINSNLRTGLPYIVYSALDASNNGTLNRYNPATSGVTTLMSFPISGVATGGGYVTSICCDFITDCIYFTDSFFKYIWKYNNSTGAKTLVSSLTPCNNLVLDYHNKHLYFIFDSDTLGRCELDGSSPTSPFGISETVVDICEDLPNNKIWVLTKDTFGTSYIYYISMFDSSLNLSTSIFTAFYDHLSFDVANNIVTLVENDGLGTIEFRSFNTTTGANTLSKTEGVAPYSQYNIRTDKNTDNLYYVTSSGTNQQLGYRNTKAAVNITLPPTVSTRIVYFDFPRDFVKQTADFQLTSPHTSFGLNYPMLSDISVVASGVESCNATFFNPSLITANKQNQVWYTSNNGNWGVFRSGDISGLTTVGPSGMTIKPTYNNYNDIASSILRLETFSVAYSGATNKFDLYSVKVKLSCSGGFVPGITMSGNPPLFLKCALRSSGNTTLFTMAGRANKATTLYIPSKITTSGTCTLFVYSKATASGNIPLYVKGGQGARTGMNLLMKAKDPNRASGICPLFVYSSTKSGINGHFSLYMSVQPPSGGYPSNMNMVIGGQGAFRQTSNMNLFLQRDPFKIAQACNLFIKNARSGITNAITLFMNAPSGTAGAVPFSGNMNLYISRRSEGFERRKTLYISGPTRFNNNTSCYVKGTVPASSVALFIKGKVTQTKTMELYSHGF